MCQPCFSLPARCSLRGAAPSPPSCLKGWAPKPVVAPSNQRAVRSTMQTTMRQLLPIDSRRDQDRNFRARLQCRHQTFAKVINKLNNNSLWKFQERMRSTNRSFLNILTFLELGYSCTLYSLSFFELGILKPTLCFFSADSAENCVFLFQNQASTWTYIRPKI